MLVVTRLPNKWIWKEIAAIVAEEGSDILSVSEAFEILLCQSFQSEMEVSHAE
jgi:hypothetical protein